MLASYRNSGFQLGFENGYTVSVQFGSSNYCSNRKSKYQEWPDTDILNSSDNAEVAIFLTESGNWRTKEVFKDLFAVDLHDDVEGYVSADTIAQLIAYVQKI